MAKGKPAKSGAKATGKKGAVNVESQSVHQSMSQLGAFHPGWPAASADDRTVFAGRHSSASCAARGKDTRGSKVLADFVAWLPKMKQGYTTGASDIEGYTARRAGLALGLATDLGHLLEQQLSAQGDSDVLQNQRSRAETSAPPVRKSLGDAIEHTLFEDDTAEHGALSAARANPVTPTGQGAALKSLVALGSDLLSRGGLWTRKCEEGALTADKVAAAQKVVDALDAANLNKLHGGNSQADSAEVNELEGRLTFEMHDLMAAFTAANKKNAKVPALAAGPGTRSLLGPRKTKPAAEPVKEPTK